MISGLAGRMNSMRYSLHAYPALPVSSSFLFSSLLFFSPFFCISRQSVMMDLFRGIILSTSLLPFPSLLNDHLTAHFSPTTLKFGISTSLFIKSPLLSSSLIHITSSYLVFVSSSPPFFLFFSLLLRYLIYR